MRRIRQHDNRDCGAACLATVLGHYKSFIPLNKIREFMHVDKNGASMFAMKKAAERFGMEAEAFEGSVEELRRAVIGKELKLPIIAHFLIDKSLLHYMVIEKINKNDILVFDPAKGRRKYAISDFEALFTGFFMAVSPGKDFAPEKKSFKPYRKFADIILKQKRLFLSAIFLSVILAGFSIFCSFAYQTIIDKYILNNSRTMDFRNIPMISNLYASLEQLCQTLPKLFAAVLFIYLTQNIIFALRGIIITHIYKNSSQLLVLNYCRALTKLPMPFFHDRETGEILSRYNDIEELQSIISGAGLSVIMDIVMAVAGGIVLFAISPELFAIVAIMTLAYALIAILYRAPIRNVSRNIMESDSKLLSKMKETVDGIESIKTACAEEEANKSLKNRAVEYIQVIRKGSLISLSQSVATGLSQSIGNLAILYFGCRFIMEGIISLGTFISFETLIYFFLSPMQNLLSMQLAMQQAFVAADRLNDVLENETEEEVFKGKEPYKKEAGTHLRICDLSFAYGYREPVLQNVSIEARGGERVAVTGRSGCGKTTLFHLIGCLESDYSGQISVNGQDIRNIDKGSYREKVIYLPQESAIFAESIRANILMGKEAQEEKLSKVIRGCALEEVISEYSAGLDFILEENGKNLSGGQKQRIALARALIREPEILLLDESTSHLDKETEKKIFDFIRQEFPDMLCFFSTHRESLAAMCDRRVDITGGKTVG